MKNCKIINNTASLEDNILVNLNLIKIAKDYCEYNYENSETTTALFFLLDIIQRNQKEIFRKIVDE